MRNILMALLFFVAGIVCGRYSTQYRLAKAQYFLDEAKRILAKAEGFVNAVKELRNEEQQTKGSVVRKDDSK